MKKIILTAGPIPAKLDSVKFLTNRFKGGLSLKLADFLSKDFNVTLVAWKHNKLSTNLPIIYVEDVIDYYNTVLGLEADCYILSAAVANLMPSNPYKGKFPSHLYEVGEKFNVEFEIAPRLIDSIKQKYPRSTLIGYKLYDGTEDELIKAAKKTLFDSKANLVFANNPHTAKIKKIALTQDGSVFDCSFEEHCELIKKLLTQNFYSTKIIQTDFFTKISSKDLEDINFINSNYPKYPADGRTYGCFAIKFDKGFITTTRGKNNKQTDYSYVESVNHEQKTIFSDFKATLNAPLLDYFFKQNPTFKYILHGHQLIGEPVLNEYMFPGTDGECQLSKKTLPKKAILLPQHGFIVGFENLTQFTEFVAEIKT